MKPSIKSLLLMLFFTIGGIIFLISLGQKESAIKIKVKETKYLLSRITYQGSGIFYIKNSWDISKELQAFVKKNQNTLEVISLAPLNVDSTEMDETNTIPIHMNYTSNDSIDITVKRGFSYLLICKQKSQGYIQKEGFRLLNPIMSSFPDSIITVDSIKIY